MVLHQEVQALCEKQLVSSHQFTEHLKQCCTQNSERLLQMPVDEKYGARKSACSGESAVSLDKCVEDRGFHGVTPSGRVRRKGPDNEAWNLGSVSNFGGGKKKGEFKMWKGSQSEDASCPKNVESASRFPFAGFVQVFYEYRQKMYFSLQI